MTDNKTMDNIKNSYLGQKISVVIPVYNVVEYLPRCLESVQGQTHQDLEIILIDDGSTDGSGELCDEFAKQDSRIMVCHTKNRGLSAARNLGIKQASGAYIGFVDSDDWLEPDMYRYLLQLLIASDADVAFVDYLIANGPEQTIQNRQEVISCYSGHDILTYYLRTNEYGVWMRLYKTDLLVDDPFDEGHIYEDVVFGFRVLKKARRIVVSNQKKYYYFVNPEGISYRPMSDKDFDLFFSGDQLMAEAAEIPSQEIQKLAKTKRQRASFTLIIRMALTGCSAELDERETAQRLRTEIKQNYWFLLRSNMPPNRKLLLTAVCINYGLVKRMAGVYGKH